MMNKEEIKAYWNYSRIFRTIPEKDYEQPQIQQFLQTYGYLETEFFKHMSEINSVKKDIDNTKEM